MMLPLKEKGKEGRRGTFGRKKQNFDTFRGKHSEKLGVFGFGTVDEKGALL